MVSQIQRALREPHRAQGLRVRCTESGAKRTKTLLLLARDATVAKGSNISKYSKRFIQKLEAKLNRRPMECLKDRTPQEVLDLYQKRIKKNKNV